MRASPHANHSPPRVLIVQRYVAQYHVPFFEELRRLLQLSGAELLLLHGEPDQAEAARGDSVSLPWATKIANRRLPVPRGAAWWQPCLACVRGADLVVVEQASRLLVNYGLLALQMAGVTRMAFWGHGRTYKMTPPSAVGEAAKTFMSKRVHWWFAYNFWSARMVQDLGYPAERTTVVQNAIDTRGLASAGAAVTQRELAELRKRHGLAGTNLCLFVGAMYPGKRLPFLIAACELVRARVPDFEMIFIGSGPDTQVVKEAVSRNSWMHLTGPLFSGDKAPYFRAAKLILMPGGVGLGILDAMALVVPLVATDVPFNGPEVDYLDNGVNGVMVGGSDSPAEYADRVAGLLADDGVLEALRAGCRKSAETFTVENMAINFANGIHAALGAPPLHAGR